MHRPVLLIIALTLLSVPASAAGLGEKCGGFVGIKCDDGLWCQRAAQRCSATDAFGACARIPQICAQVYQPVCGCDGKTYGNDCQRQAAQVNLAQKGPCR